MALQAEYWSPARFRGSLLLNVEDPDERSSRQDETERVAGRVQEDPERLTRLHLVLAGAERDDRRLAGVEVGDLEVQVELLRVPAPGHCGGR